MVILGIFILFLVVGVFMFATYGTSNENESSAQINIWGTLPSEYVSSVLNTVKDRYRNQTIPYMTYIEVKNNVFEKANQVDYIRLLESTVLAK